MSKAIKSFFATCSHGLEQVLTQELTLLGFRNVRTARQGAEFTGPLEEGWRACLWSRTASRILMPIAEFKAFKAREIYNHAKKVRWEDHMSSLGTFAIQGIGTNSEIRHSGFLALTVKDAVVDRMREKVGRRPNVDKEDPDVQIMARIINEQVTLSLDLSGRGLHRRGWRSRHIETPIRETLAASLLQAAGYRGERVFFDPMCGSGTFLIEAAELALGLAPGRNNTFGIERWPSIPRPLKRQFSAEKREGNKPKSPKIPMIFGSDVSPEAVSVSRYHIESAGLGQYIRLDTADARKARMPAGKALVVTNPPYGERIEEPEEELLALYREMGTNWKHMGDGRVAIFCSHPGFRKAFGLKPTETMQLFNGPIQTTFYIYEVGSHFVPTTKTRNKRRIVRNAKLSSK